MRNLNNANSKYYYAEDIKEIMEFSSLSSAYRLIAKINEDLKRQGMLVKRGAVPKAFFESIYPNENNKVTYAVKEKENV